MDPKSARRLHEGRPFSRSNNVSSDFHEIPFSQPRKVLESSKQNSGALGFSCPKCLKKIDHSNSADFADVEAIPHYF